MPVALSTRGQPACRATPLPHRPPPARPPSPVCVSFREDAAMVQATDQIPVPFSGAGSGDDELTWGQWEIWRAMCLQQSSLPMSAIRELSSGTTVDELISEIRFYMSRYESMRTRLRFDSDGRPRQVVSGSGVAVLDIVEVSPEGDPAATAQAVRDGYTARDFDYVREWPMRAAIVRQAGVPTHLVVVLCHLAADGGGVAVMLRDHAAYQAAGGSGPPEPAGSPLELARREREPATRAQGRTALRYWAGLLRTVPAHRFVGCGEPQRPRYWQISLESSAIWLTLPAAVTRYQVDTAPILLAAHAIAVARYSGAGTFVTRVVVSNRFRSKLADVVAPVNQTGLLVVDLSGATVAEALARVRRQALSAYKYAYYDPTELDRTLRQATRDRGEELDLSFFYNDRRVEGQQPDGPPVSRQRAHDARQAGNLRVDFRQDRPTDRFFQHVESEPGMIRLLAAADTHHLSPDGMRALLLGMEQAVLELAYDPDLPVETTASPADPPVQARSGGGG